MSKGNVLADNPLDFMLGGRDKGASEADRAQVVALERQVTEQPPTAEPNPAPETATTPSETASAEPERARAAVQVKAKEPSEGAGARDEQSGPSEPPPADAEPASADGEQGSRSRLNRIGTIRQPYTRADGVQTRQASVTLPVDLLKRLGHFSIESGMKTSQITRLALEAYLDARGY